MRKLLLLFLLSIIISTALHAFSLQDWKNSLDMSIRDQAEKGFADLFKTKVSIKEAGGRLTGQIVLENCEIAYIDLVGFMGEPTNFQAIAKGVNGEVDLRNIERITFSAAGAVPETVKAAGLG